MIKVFIHAVLIASFLSCLGRVPRVEYAGPPLDSSEAYHITQISSSVFSIKTPPHEHILINLYNAADSLVLTLYNDVSGRTGSFTISLASQFSTYGIELEPGNYRIVLYGENGRTQFNAIVQ